MTECSAQIRVSSFFSPFFSKQTRFLLFLQSSRYSLWSEDDKFCLSWYKEITDTFIFLMLNSWLALVKRVSLFFIRPGFIKHSYPGKFVHLQQQTAVFTLDLLLFPLMLSSNSWRKPSEGWAGAAVAQEAEQVVQFTPPQWEFSNLARLGKNVSEDLDLVFGLGPVCCSLIIKVAVQFCTCVIWDSSKKWIIINKYIIQFEKLKQKTPKQL